MFSLKEICSTITTSESSCEGRMRSWVSEGLTQGLAHNVPSKAGLVLASSGF